MDRLMVLKGHREYAPEFTPPLVETKPEEEEPWEEF